MKGKVSFYFNAPNTGKVRSRIEKPSEDFTKKLREAVQEVIIDVVNANTYDIRARLVKKFAEMNETAKDEKAAAQLTSPLNSFFDVMASSTPFKEEEAEEEEPEAKKDEFED